MLPGFFHCTGAIQPHNKINLLICWALSLAQIEQKKHANFMHRGCKTHHKATDRGEVRTPATVSLHHAPGPQSYRDSTCGPIYHTTAPKPRALSHKMWFPNYFTSVTPLEAVIRPWQGLFAGEKPLLPLPSTRGDLGRPSFQRWGLLSPVSPHVPPPVPLSRPKHSMDCHVAELTFTLNFMSSGSLQSPDTPYLDSR